MTDMMDMLSRFLLPKRGVKLTPFQGLEAHLDMMGPHSQGTDFLSQGMDSGQTRYPGMTPAAGAPSRADDS